MNTVIIVLIILVLLLYIKWIAFILYLLIALCSVRYSCSKSPNIIDKALFVPYYIVERILKFGGQRWFLYQTATIPSMHVRKWIYSGLGASIGKKVVIHFRTELREPTSLHIGDGSIIGDNVLLDARNGIDIGESVNISSNVSIYTDQHNYKDPNFKSYTTNDRRMKVKIGDRVWLGANVIVLPGVIVGEGAVCCAGCVVTKDVAPYSVVAGIPAVKVAERPGDMKYNFTGRTNRLY